MGNILPEDPADKSENDCLIEDEFPNPEHPFINNLKKYQKNFGK
jgi:hypothetical protein